MNRRARRQSGFTLLEVMMTLAIMMVSIMGIVGLQRAAIRANIEARSTAVATSNNARWTSILRRRALAWNAESGGIDATVDILGATQGEWFIPETKTGPEESFALDWFGQPAPKADSSAFRYCTLLRLRTMAPDVSMRVDVVTFWAAQGNATSPGAAEFLDLCKPGNGGDAGDALFGASPKPGLRHFRSTVVLRRVPP